MRILLLGSGTIGSSLSARLVNLGRALVEQGHDVTLMVPHTDKYSHHRPDRVESLHGMSVIHPFQLSGRNDVVNFLTYVPSAAWHVWRCPADIVHIYKPTPLTVVGLIKRWSRRSRVVVDIDDLGFAVMAREGHHPLKVRLVKWSEVTAARAADAIITASSYLQASFRKLYPDKPIVWIPNGVQAVVSGTDSPASPAVVFVGSLNAGGSASELIEAIPCVLGRVAPFVPRVLVIGDGTERAVLETRVRELGLAGTVTFTGWVRHEELAGYVPAGSLGICCAPDTDASRAASNQKVFDYLSLGTVPIVTSVGDLPYYVDYGRGGYVIDDNLATTLAMAINDTAGRLQRLEAGRLHLAANFLWSTLGRDVAALYRSVIPNLAGSS